MFPPTPPSAILHNHVGVGVGDPVASVFVKVYRLPTVDAPLIEALPPVGAIDAAGVAKDVSFSGLTNSS